MRLTELRPKWWVVDEEDHTIIRDEEMTPTSRVIGVSFACPFHAKEGFDQYDNAKCSMARVYVAFTNPVDGKASFRYHKVTWKREGETFETLVLSPSIRCNGTHWHGFIGGEVGPTRRPGEVTTCGDTTGADP